MEKYKFIKCVSFDSDINLEEFDSILLEDLDNKDIRIIQLKDKIKNNYDTKKLALLLKNLGISKFHFRKGVGYKGIVQRLKFAEFKKNEKKVIFYRMKKEGRRFTIDKNNTLILPMKELKYIYPLILSPEIKEDKVSWNHNYIIYPYEFGEKKPISEEKFKKEAPVLFNYLKAHKEELLNQSSYNSRIQNNKEFYSLIRIGEYTYSSIYLIMRDNTKVISQIIKYIQTDWGEKKIPIFDNHISYLSRINNREITEKEAKKIKEVLSWKETKAIIEGIFDSRSISSRIPIKIERIIDEVSRVNK